MQRRWSRLLWQAAVARGGEGAAKADDFAVSASLRSLVIGDRWKDEELGAECMALRNKGVLAIGCSPGARWLAWDLELE